MDESKGFIFTIKIIEFYNDQHNKDALTTK